MLLSGVRLLFETSVIIGLSFPLAFNEPDVFKQMPDIGLIAPCKLLLKRNKNYFREFDDWFKIEKCIPIE